MTIKMTPEEFVKLGSKGRHKSQDKSVEQPSPSPRKWWQSPLSWVLVGFLLIGLADVADTQRQVDQMQVQQVELATAVGRTLEIVVALESRVAELEETVQYAAESALLQRVETDLETTRVAIGESALAFVVELPNEPEDAMAWLSRALISLGATADCPGECLSYVDANGTMIEFHFNP